MKDLLKQIQKSSDRQLKAEAEKPPKLPDHVTTKEIAEMIRVSKRTVHRRMNEAENPLPPACYKRKGGVSLWSRQVVLDWWETEKTIDRSSNIDQPSSDGEGSHG